MINKVHVLQAAVLFGLLYVPLSASAEKPTQVEVINPVLPVEVSNANPVPVGLSSLPLKPSEIPANRYQTTLSVDAWTTSSDGSSYISMSSSWDIPSDKILVVEFLSAQALVNPGDNVYLSVVCQGAGSYIGLSRILMPLAATGTFGSREYLIGSGAVKCYTGSFMLVTLYRDRDSAVPAGLIGSGQVSVVGYLMDKPQ